MASPPPVRAGRRLFGGAPALYDRVRFGYPPGVYDLLRRRCGLGPGCRTFEIGPGTGKATRELLRRGARPLLAVEPDLRLARYLRGHLGSRGSSVRIVRAPFEQTDLPEAAFDLGVAATSFHWLDERVALPRVRRALRPGGWWAVWGNIHGDLFHPGPFHQAIQPLYGPRSERAPTWSQGARPVSEMQLVRLRALRSCPGFDRIGSKVFRWQVDLSAERATALWSTFSDVALLPPKRRSWFLREFRRIADEQFGGRVRFTMLTPTVTARREPTARLPPGVGPQDGGRFR